MIACSDGTTSSGLSPGFSGNGFSSAVSIVFRSRRALSAYALLRSSASRVTAMRPLFQSPEPRTAAMTIRQSGAGLRIRWIRRTVSAAGVPGRSASWSSE